MDAICPECKTSTVVVFDRSAGDTICTECGLVLEAHVVDETSEWRSFCDDKADNYDPSRVGDPNNPLLSSSTGLSTVISGSKGGSSKVLSSSLIKCQARGSLPDRNLIHAFNAIAAMSDRLGLVTTIQDRAKEIYKKVEDQKLVKSRNQEAIVAACLYIACRLENKPRTVNEISSVVHGTTKKEIGRAHGFLMKHLELEMRQSKETGSIDAADYLRRFCSGLGMPNRHVKAAEEAVQKSKELDIRRNPISIAAAIIYIISQLSGEKKSAKDVSVVTGAAEGTIRSCYKDLYPYLSRLIPAWFANQQEIKYLLP
ncbi:hypothetical protein DITRI_Ditri03aG0117500 [Diplodiscus trichospermus]